MVTCLHLALLAFVGHSTSIVAQHPLDRSLDVSGLPSLNGDVWQDEPSTESMVVEHSPSSVDYKKQLALAFVRKQLKAYPVPGVALSVVFKNKTVISQGFGTTSYGQPKAAVTDKTMFQIGSYTKTFIALAIAKLAEEKKLTWQDPVKKHLPSFRLVDKYAEAHTTLEDLAGMNSVFGDHEGDAAWLFGVHGGEKGLVDALGSLNTTRPFRAGNAYSNLNTEILGQVIEAVTKRTWPEYLRVTFWDPLGMKDTVGRPADSSRPELLSSGHRFCDNKVAGPYNLVNSTVVALVPGNGYLSAGSVVSSAADLSKFSLFLLNKGKGIFASDAAVANLITGHTIASTIGGALPYVGLSFSPDGNALTAGLGFDVVGDVAFGRHYYDKGGDTIGHQTRNGFIPDRELGVVLVANAQSGGGKISSFVYLDLIRTYITGLFLDVPVSKLNKGFNTIVSALDKLPSPPCDPHFFDGEPWETPGLDIPNRTKTILNGTYHATTSTAFYGPATVFLDGKDLVLKYGAYARKLIATPDPNTFVWAVDVGGQTVFTTVSGLDTGRPSVVLDGLGLTFVHD